jgi:hypothetical protein
MNIRAAALMAADGPRRDNFNAPLRVDGDRSRIASVVLLCSDHNTCSLTSGDRDVKLAFSRRGSGRRRTARRRVAPRLPAQTVPGIYMLFVVDGNGVPGLARKVILAR